MDWTEQQVAELTRLWNDEEIPSTAAIARQMGLTKGMVLGKAHRLGFRWRESPIASKTITGRRRPKTEPVNNSMNRRARHRESVKRPLRLLFDGKVYPSRKALARHLAPLINRSTRTVARMLQEKGDEVTAVIEHCRKRGRGNRRARQQIITHDGVNYPSQAALARYIAGVVGRNPTSVQHRLAQLDNAGAAVIDYYRVRGRPRRPSAYDGVNYPSRAALARVLAAQLALSVVHVSKLLRQHRNDVAGVLQSRRRNYKSITHDGVTYPSRAALARLLAPKLALSPQRVDGLLRKHRDDAEAVLASRTAPRIRRPRRTDKPIIYNGVVYPSRAALARVLAPRLAISVNSVTGLLSQYHGDVDAVLRSRDQPPPPRRTRPITYNGVTYPNRLALARLLVPHLGVGFERIWQLLRQHHDDVDAMLQSRQAAKKRRRGPPKSAARTGHDLAQVIAARLGIGINDRIHVPLD